MVSGVEADNKHAVAFEVTRVFVEYGQDLPIRDVVH
jgi:hypothetical protein